MEHHESDMSPLLMSLNVGKGHGRTGAGGGKGKEVKHNRSGIKNGPRVPIGLDVVVQDGWAVNKVGDDVAVLTTVFRRVFILSQAHSFKQFIVSLLVPIVPDQNFLVLFSVC